MKKFYILFLIVISFLILPSLTNAQSYTWNGSQSSKWFNPLNWTPSTGVPNSSSDSVTIDINLPNEPVIDSGNVVLKYLKINQSSVILTVSNNASLSIVGVPGLITGFIKGSGSASIIFTDTLKVPASFTINLFDSANISSNKAALLLGGNLACYNTSTFFSDGPFNKSSGLLNLNDSSTLYIVDTSVSFSGTNNFVSTSTVNFGKALSIPNLAYGNLTLSANAGSYLITNDLNITGSFTQNNTSIFLMNNQFIGTRIINIGKNLVLSGSPATFSMRSFAGAGNTTLNIGGNLIISDSSTLEMEPISLDTSRIIISGNFTATSKSNAILDFGIGAIGGNEVRIAGNFLKSGTGKFASTANNAATGFVFNKTGIQTFSYSGTLSEKINYTVSSNATLLMLTGLTLGSGAPMNSITVNGILDCDNFTINGGATNGVFTLAAAATLRSSNVNGIENLTIGSVSTSIATRDFSNSANYEFYGNSSITNTGFPNSTIKNLLILNSSTVNLGNDLTIGGTLTLYSGIFELNTRVLTIAGGISRNSGAISPSTSTIIFTNITSTTLPAGLFNSNVNNLTMNGAGGIITDSSFTIAGVLTLTNGKITTTSSKLVIISNTGSVTGASFTSFINGPVKKIGSSSFVFPTGKIGTGYQAVGISAPGNTTDAFTAEYIRESPYVLGYKLDTGLVKVSGCEYWLLDRNTGTDTVDITLYGNSNSGCDNATGADYFTGNSSSITTLRVTHFNASNATWENLGGSATGTSPNVTVTATGVNTFSPFTFGSASLNPLPVKLISFTGKTDGNHSILNWATASEKNNDHFSLERSADGKTFTELVQIPGAFNSSILKNYNWNDRHQE